MNKKKLAEDILFYAAKNDEKILSIIKTFPDDNKILKEIKDQIHAFVQKPLQKEATEYKPQYDKLLNNIIKIEKDNQFINELQKAIDEQNKVNKRNNKDNDNDNEDDNPLFALFGKSSGGLGALLKALSKKNKKKKDELNKLNKTTQNKKESTETNKITKNTETDTNQSNTDSDDKSEN